VTDARSNAPPRARRRRRRWPWLLAAALLLAGGSTAALARRASGEAFDPALVVTAARAPLAIEVIDVGRIEAATRVEIESKLPGRIASVLVQEGDQVAAGAPLILLESRDFQRAAAGDRTAVARGRAQLAFAELDLDRKQRGLSAGLVSRAEQELSLHSRELARLELAAARVALARAQDRLQDAKITAPIAGTVIRRAIEPGEMVAPAIESQFQKRSLLTIADLSRLIAKLELNQIDVAKLRIGQRVSLAIDALPGERFSGTISEIAPASVRPPGKEHDVFPVEASLEKADPRIKPGMTADVRIQISERPRALALPIESVRREGDKSFVTRLRPAERGDTRERVEVVLGVKTDRMVEVLSGIGEGDRVLLDPASAADNETRI
jgi:membrane fusion protein, macrolide-specific efflux system